MIIFLHGDDTFRSREKLRELKEKFLREVDPSGMNLVTIDGTSATADEIWAAVAAQSFLVRKRMVVVEDLGAQKSNAVREGVAGFLERIPEDVIAVFWEGRSHAPTSSSRVKRGISPKRGKGATAKNAPKEDSGLSPLLLKEKFAQEFAPLDGVALSRWVQDRAKVLGATIEPAAIRELTAIVGPDLWRMANELEKLSLAARDKPIISPLIRDLVDIAPSDSFFTFLDAVGQGDRAAAIRCLRELEAARVDPHHLLAMLHRQLRLLVMAADCLERGVPPSQLAAELGVHPYVAQKLVAQTQQRVAKQNFVGLYPRLLELDRKLKSSRAPWQVLMDLFVFDVMR